MCRWGRNPTQPCSGSFGATREKRLVVEPTLPEALAPFQHPLGYLDFETVSRAVPVWPGLAPWGPAIAQFSYHEDQPDGTYTPCRVAGRRPRRPEPGGRRGDDQCNGGGKPDRDLLCLRKDPDQRAGCSGSRSCRPLEELLGKLVDLLPVVRNNVYHPDFRGSFSLKYILTPLVPDLTYNDLVIVDGRLASVEIARLLFVAHKIPLRAGPAAARLARVL